MSGAELASSTQVRRLAIAGRLDLALLGAIGIASVWSLAFAIVALHRHDTVRSHRFDLGNMVQAVWSTAHGRPLDVTVATGEQMSRLGVHVDPILALFAPLWWLFPTPSLLLVIQALALGSGAVAVFLLARRHLEVDAAALLVAAAYLLYPSVAWNTVNDFHPITLAIPLLLFATLFLDAGRLRPFALCAGLALLTGELIGLTVGALGLWYAVSRRERRVGAVIAVVGFGWTALCLKVIVPAFAGGDSSVFYGNFENVGGSPAGMVRTAFTEPGRLISELTTLEDIRYLLLLLVPLLGMCFASSLVLVAVPQLALNMLADQQSTTLPQYQYVAGALPFLFAATVFGLAKLGPKRRPFIGLALAGACAVTLALIPPRPGLEPYVFAERDSSAHLAALEQAVSLVPGSAAVSSTNRVGGQLSARRYVYSFPERDRADWVIVDRDDPWLAVGRLEGDQPLLFRKHLAGLKADRRFRVVFERDGVSAYRRVA